MNKIIIDTEEYFKDIKEDLLLEIKSDSKVTLKIFSNAKIIIINSNYHLLMDITFENNTNLTINSLGIDSSIDYNVILKDNNNLSIVNSIITKNDSLNNINIIHEGKNSQTTLIANGINLENNKLYFTINGTIYVNSLNSLISENSKIINLKDGDSKIIPNLIIDCKEVNASHSAYIGTFNNEDIYYLMSRQISYEDSKKLLIKAILLSKFEPKEIFSEIIDKEIGGIL